MLNWFLQTRTIKTEEGSEDQEMAVRTKVGEALVKITKELGEVTPKYKNLLLNSFFSAANDPDHLVRASSLSNMGKLYLHLNRREIASCHQFQERLLKI